MPESAKSAEGGAKKEPAPEQPAPTDGGGSKTGLIILIVVLGVIVILGLGGWFVWKSWSKKLANKLTGKTTDNQPAAVEKKGKISTQSVVDALMYPGSKVTDRRQGEEQSAYAAELTLATTDIVPTIKNYYLSAINKNGWKITREGARDENNYYVFISDKNFTAEIEANKYSGYDTTDINIKISGENLSNNGIESLPAAAKTTTPTTAQPFTTAPSTGTGASSEYIIGDSSARLLSESELTNLTPWQLKVARNEIYARRGRPFVHKDLQCYFDKQSWYKINPSFSESDLSTIENKNVATILAYEQKINSPFLQKDSGCQK